MRTAPKCRGSSFAVGTYLQRGSPPPRSVWSSQCPLCEQCMDYSISSGQRVVGLHHLQCLLTLDGLQAADSYLCPNKYQ